MKAAVIEAPGQLSVRDLPEPVPGDYQALCELLYGAVCSGTDQHLVAGHEPFCHWIKLPAVLGHESIGRVTTVGPKVRYLKPGDLITRVGTPAVGGVEAAWGGFAEFGIATDWQAMQADGLPREKWQGARVQRILPPEISPAEATMLITWRETWSYITRIGIAAGQNVLIVGSGGNGFSFAIHARNSGAARVVIFGSATRQQTARALGVELIDYQGPKAGAALKALAPGGYHLLVDAIGKASGVNSVLHLLAPNAKVGIYGMDDVGNYHINPMAAPSTFTICKSGYDEAEAHDAVLEHMRAGRLRAGDFLTNLDRPYSLADINLALDAVRNRSCLKSLVRLRTPR